MPTNFVVIIGDIVHSRSIRERVSFNLTLQNALSELNAANKTILSPYTITIGDEIQAVFQNADHLFHDSIFVAAALYPHQMRFSYSLGPLVTPINPHQAIGMDGPVFHSARDGVEYLKKKGGIFHLSGPAVHNARLLQPCLELLSHEVEGWNYNRLMTLALLMENRSIKEIAAQLKVSDKAIYKTIDAGALYVVIQLLDEITQNLNRQLQSEP